MKRVNLGKPYKNNNKKPVSLILTEAKRGKTR